MEAHRESQTHLTDEQFTDLLMGTSQPSVREHLKVCSQCSQEAERVSGAIGSFKEQSGLWAERRASSHPILTRRPQSAFAWLHIPTASQAWTAALLMIALATGIGVSMHKERVQSVQQQVAKVQPTAQVTPATLKADNELLSAIDGELRVDESTPASMYGLTPASHGVRAKSSKRVSNE